jgi:alpha-1,6-mannosyltransferase
MCGAGAWLGRGWFARTPSAFAPNVAQPLPVVTAWGSFGAQGFAILAATLGAAALALVFAARGRRCGPVTIVAFAAATLAANVAWPAVFSSDVYAYAAYGDLAARGFDPYLVAPAGLHDPFLDAARFQWSGPFPVCVYGPAFVAFARGVVELGGGFGVAATLALFRALACTAFLGSIALLSVGLHDTTPERRSLALYAYGLNPVALWGVAEGHNDALLLLAAMGAFALARRRNALLGSFALALGPLVKAPGALLALVYAVRCTWLGRVPEQRAWLGFFAGSVVATAIALPPLVPALTRLGTHGVYAPSVSAQGLVGPAWAALAAGALFARGAWLLFRRETSGFAWSGLAIVVVLPNTYPWYALWLLPLVLAAGPEPAAAALWGATIFALMRYLPDATGDMSANAARFASAIAALPLLLAVADFRPLARRKTPTLP